MKISYKPLWRQLVEKNMSKMDLLYASGISACTLAKFEKNEPVRLDILMNVYKYFLFFKFYIISDNRYSKTI